MIVLSGLFYLGEGGGGLVVQELLMARYPKHVGPVCQNARNAPERRS